MLTCLPRALVLMTVSYLVLSFVAVLYLFLRLESRVKGL